MTTLDEARAALQRHARGPAFVAALEAFEAAVRANERGGTTRAAVLREAADAVFALEYDVMVGEEGDENMGSMREAWDVGTIHASQLLRRLADEAQQQPEAQDTCRSIEVDGQTISVRGQGVPAEQDLAFFGEVVRAAKRRYAAEHPADAQHADTETVHACPPDGSGLTPCCGRTPFELPLGDRISSEAPTTCTGPTAGAQQDGASS